MSARRHVEWAAVAEADLKNILAGIALAGPGNAVEAMGKITQKASGLYRYPERGRIVPELQGQGIDIYRELLVPPWRIIYRASETTVYVLPVIDSRLNIEDVLLNRLIK